MTRFQSSAGRLSRTFFLCAILPGMILHVFQKLKRNSRVIFRMVPQQNHHQIILEEKMLAKITGFISIWFWVNYDNMIVDIGWWSVRGMTPRVFQKNDDSDGLNIWWFVRARTAISIGIIPPGLRREISRRDQPKNDISRLPDGRHGSGWWYHFLCFHTWDDGFNLYVLGWLEKKRWNQVTGLNGLDSRCGLVGKMARSTQKIQRL